MGKFPFNPDLNYFLKAASVCLHIVLSRVCKYPTLVDNALPLMRLAEKWLGERMFSAVARPTFYTQFVGGDTEQELALTASKVSSVSGFSPCHLLTGSLTKIQASSLAVACMLYSYWLT